MLLIGSAALAAHGIKTWRLQQDIDFICTMDEFNEMCKREKPAICYPLSGNKMITKNSTGRCITEYEIAWPSSTAAALLEIEHCTKVASLEALLALKLSHRYLRNSPAFLKTMRDIHLLRDKGVVLTPELKEWLVVREKETLNYGHPNLKQTKAQFFDPSVKYVYDHDSVHRAVMLFDKPAYEFYKCSDKEVQCSKDLFFEQSREIQLAGVMEEAMVLALERSIIPHPGVKTPREAFEMALMKVCTSITSGWFREFAWENYDAVMRLFNAHERLWPYVDQFWLAEAAGEVPLISQEKERM